MKGLTYGIVYPNMKSPWPVVSDLYQYTKITLSSSSCFYNSNDEDIFGITCCCYASLVWFIIGWLIGER